MNTGQIDLTQAMGKLFLQQEIVANLTPDNNSTCAAGDFSCLATCSIFRSNAR